MPKARIPLSKAHVSGAAAKNPQRFRGRKAPKAPPIGAPYARMTKAQRTVWAEMSKDMPWLNRGHRVLLRLACVLTAKMDEDEDGSIGVSAAHALSSILSKLGATPVDETKVAHGNDGEEEDPGEGFFGRPN